MFKSTVSRREFVASLSGLALAAGVQATPAYPVKAVRFVVPAPPGGINDIVGRIVAQRLARRLGQPFVVDNRPGASGSLAVEAVVRAPADGHTMHIGNPVTFITNPYIFKDSPVQPGTDTVAVALIAQMANAVAVPPGTPFATFTELLAHARAHPGKLAYGSPGNGTAPHLFMELIKARAGVDLLHVPFRGSAQLATELMAGRVDVALENLPVLAGPAKSGQLRLLAVTSPEPWPLAPELPTLHSQGLKDTAYLNWSGLFVSARTPAAIVATLNQEVNALLREPDVVRQLETLGARPLALAPDEIGRFMAGERRLWTDAVKASGAKVDG